MDRERELFDALTSREREVLAEWMARRHNARVCRVPGERKGDLPMDKGYHLNRVNSGRRAGCFPATPMKHIGIDLRRKLLAAAVIILMLAAPAHAEEPTPFRLGTHEAIPKRISDVALGIDLGLDAWHSLVRTDARARWGFGCRLALDYAIVELAKRAIHRERPNHQDFYSMPSGHSAFAAAAAHSSFSASLALTVAWGRQAGGMHYASDVALGAGIGLFSRKVCPE